MMSTFATLVRNRPFPILALRRCGECALRIPKPSSYVPSRSIASTSRLRAEVKPGPALSQTNRRSYLLTSLRMTAENIAGAEITLRRFWKTVHINQEPTGPSAPSSHSNQIKSLIQPQGNTKSASIVGTSRLLLDRAYSSPRTDGLWRSSSRRNGRIRMRC